MEANELRINNYVYPFDDIYLVTKKTILEDCIQVCFKDFENTNELHPIPLTEEWFLKFGFEKSDTYYTYWINEFKAFIIMSDSRREHYFLCDCDVDTNIQYVHELQNLYFALTKQELTINN